MHKFRLYRYLGHGRFVGGGVGGSKRKRPNDVVGEKIDMFVAPKCRPFQSNQTRYKKGQNQLRLHPFQVM